MALKDAREIVDAENDEHLGLILEHRSDPPIFGWLVINPEETSEIETGEESSLEAAMEKAMEVAVSFGIKTGIEFRERETW